MEVMKQLKFSHPFRLVWQSKVGPMPWQGPSTEDAIKGILMAYLLKQLFRLSLSLAYIEKGFKNLMLVPISFVNEHIETLHELDIEYCKELCEKVSGPDTFWAYYYQLVLLQLANTLKLFLVSLFAPILLLY